MKTKKTLRDYVQGSGYPDYTNIINLFIGGSELHGAKIEGTDDHDIYGVYVESPEAILGTRAMNHDQQHFVWSTATDDRRNTADDVDITLYSLQKWAYLACKGNVTKLHFLFAENLVNKPSDPRVCDFLWQELTRRKEIFLAKSHLNAFIRFSDDQLKRMTGEKGQGKKGHRPTLEEGHGFDVKSAMHAIRILYEGLELLTTCKITLPGQQKQLLIEIRSGKWGIDKILSHAEDLKSQCRKAQEKSSLPESIDRTAVDQLVAQSYRDFWAWRESSRPPS